LSRARTLANIVVCAFVLHAGAAHAGDEDDARAAMRRGVAAFGRGEAEVALVEYDTAKRLVPDANAPYRYAAEALGSLGRWPEAVTNLETYLAKNPGVRDAAEVRERITKIRAEHFPGRLRVLADADGATVIVDGEPKGPVGVLDLAAGRHRVEVAAPGTKTAVQEVTVIGDRDSTVELTLVVEPPPLDPGAPVAAPSPSPDRLPPAVSPWRTVGWVTAGVGVATLLTTTIVDAAVLGPKVSDYRSAADHGDTTARGLRDDAQGLQTGVVVGYVVGSVLALGGLAVAVFAPTSTGTSARISPSLAPGYAGLNSALTF
jgi:tetratricopeptide (TPR) repeat protein